MSKRTPVIPIKLTDIREEDEYITEANKIKDMYLVEKREAPKALAAAEAITAPRASLREQILSLSLFPHLYTSRSHRTFSGMKADNADPDRLMKKRTQKEIKEGLADD